MASGDVHPGPTNCSADRVPVYLLPSRWRCPLSSAGICWIGSALDSRWCAACWRAFASIEGEAGQKSQGCSFRRDLKVAGLSCPARAEPTVCSSIGLSSPQIIVWCTVSRIQRRGGDAAGQHSKKRRSGSKRPLWRQRPRLIAPKRRAGSPPPYAFGPHLHHDPEMVRLSVCLCTSHCCYLVISPDARFLLPPFQLHRRRGCCEDGGRIGGSGQRWRAPRRAEVCLPSHTVARFHSPCDTHCLFTSHDGLRCLFAGAYWTFLSRSCTRKSRRSRVGGS
jgi:hypothetical protein